MSDHKTISGSSEEPTSSSTLQHLTIPFNCRSQHGKVEITLRPNCDPVHAHGLDLIFPDVSRASFAEQFFGFPVMHGAITYPIPASLHLSYGNLFGWIQFVRSVPGQIVAEDEHRYSGWEMDIFPYAKDLQTPFAYWGFNPSIFDAPARLLETNGKVQNLEWRAQSFLCILEDAGMTKRVKLVPGVGFGWGFDIQAKDKEIKRDIIISGLEILDAEKEWVDRLGLLRDLYPAWTFIEA